MIVEDWDGLDPPDYEWPVKPGDAVLLTRGATTITSRVVRTEGYGPGYVQLEYGVVVDLVGWDLRVVVEPT